MQTKRRWIRSAIEAAETLDVQMPWERGARRAAWIASRRGHPPLRAALSA